MNKDNPLENYLPLLIHFATNTGLNFLHYVSHSTFSMALVVFQIFTVFIDIINATNREIDGEKLTQTVTEMQSIKKKCRKED